LVLHYLIITFSRSLSISQFTSSLFFPSSSFFFLFFFFNATSTTEIYTLSLHDALPIFYPVGASVSFGYDAGGLLRMVCSRHTMRSEEHTSELQSRVDLVCRLLLEKKKTKERKNEKHKNHKQQTS